LFAEAFDVVAGAFDEALGLDQLAALGELPVGLGEFGFDVVDCVVELVLRGDEVLRGIDVDLVELGEDFAGEGIELADALDLVVEEVDPDGKFFVSGEDGEAIAAEAEAAADEVLVVAFVLHVYELAEDAVAVAGLALLEAEDEVVVLGRLAEAVDAGDRGDDD
jgi:hypothetical protein